MALQLPEDKDLIAERIKARKKKQEKIKKGEMAMKIDYLGERLKNKKPRKKINVEGIKPLSDNAKNDFELWCEGK